MACDAGGDGRKAEEKDLAEGEVAMLARQRLGGLLQLGHDLLNLATKGLSKGKEEEEVTRTRASKKRTQEERREETWPFQPRASSEPRLQRCVMKVYRKR